MWCHMDIKTSGSGLGQAKKVWFMKLSHDLQSRCLFLLVKTAGWVCVV